MKNKQNKTTKECVIQGCERLSMSIKHQLCRAHLTRYYKGDKVEGEIRKRKKYQPFKIE